VQLHRDREQFDASGAHLAVIGQGTPEQAARFQGSQEMDLPIYTDKGRESYKAAGTKIGTVDELVGPRMIAKGARAMATDGVRQGRTVGHPAQLGGVLVIRPGDEIVYAHLSDDAGDIPPNSEVLAAARAAAES
jgi:prostamide/prostaglandin F2alpha synthase